MAKLSPILAAIYREDYEYLERMAPHFLIAIADELRQGKTPRDIKHAFFANTTPDRNGMAIRCYNAAIHMTLIMESEVA